MVFEFERKTNSRHIIKSLIVHALALLPIALVVFLAQGQPAQAKSGITVTGTTIEFLGIYRPGDIPQDPITMHQADFATAASTVPADPVCNDCRTQFYDTDGKGTLGPITVDQALTGYPTLDKTSANRTSFFIGNSGDLVLTFSNIQLVNHAGPDLAVFEGFVQSGFSIKVLTAPPDGKEYPLKNDPVTGLRYFEIPAQPFIQLTDSNYEKIFQEGPCPLEKDLNLCGTDLNHIRSQILLIYQIDLSELGVPSNTPVEKLFIGPNHMGGNPVNIYPHVVMAGALTMSDDTQPPTIPTDLTAMVTSVSTIDVVWTAAIDDVGVTTYKIYRDGTLLAALGNVLNYSDTNLASSTTYTYTVSACDAAGNCSEPSNEASATTVASDIMQAPASSSGGGGGAAMNLLMLGLLGVLLVVRSARLPRR